MKDKKENTTNESDVKKLFVLTAIMTQIAKILTA